MDNLRKTYALISFLSFVVFIALLLTGRLSEIMRAYLDWLKEARIMLVLPLFLVLSVGSSKIIASGILQSILDNDPVRTQRLFGWIIALTFCLQMLGWFLNLKK